MIRFQNTSLFSLEMPVIPWGDYGDILFHGDAGRDDQSGLLKLSRTGVYVPPITFPGLPGIVVTDSFRSALGTSKLTGFTFQSIIKHHIVDLDWSDWKGDEPAFYPASGEPEDYLYEAPHSPEIAEQMPELWELLIGETVHVHKVEDQTVEYGVILSLLKETWNGDDFFRAPEVGHTFVSEKAKIWLETYAKDLVDFREW